MALHALVKWIPYCCTGTSSHLYVKTNVAWYILESFAKIYWPFFLSFWTQCRLFHLLVSSCLADPSITLPNFISSLEISPPSNIGLTTDRGWFHGDNNGTFWFLNVVLLEICYAWLAPWSMWSPQDQTCLCSPHLRVVPRLASAWSSLWWTRRTCLVLR